MLAWESTTSSQFPSADGGGSSLSAQEVPVAIIGAVVVAAVVVLVVGAVIVAASLIAWKLRSGKTSTGKRCTVVHICFVWWFRCGTYFCPVVRR